MSERTQHLRDLLTRHEPWDPYGTGLQLLDIIDEHARRIQDLRETISNQYQRHSNQIADLRKQIDKLSGVHGA